MRPLIIALALMAISVSAAAQPTAPSPFERNSKIVAAVPGAKETFVVERDGKVRHLQSGGLCPARFENNALLAAVLLLPATKPGTDVACDYARRDAQGRTISKLTLSFIKAPEKVSLDTLFYRYRNEISSIYPGAKASPSALKFTDNATKQTRKDYRSITYTFSVDDKPVSSELIVGIFNGWVLKVRATAPKEGTKDDLRNALLDTQNPYIAFGSAQASLTAASPSR